MKDYSQRKAEHKCVWCGVTLPKNDKRIMCEEHRKRSGAIAHKCTEKMMAENRCYRCGKQLPEHSQFKACLACRIKESKRRKRNDHNSLN